MNKNLIITFSVFLILIILSNPISSETIILNDPPYIPSNPNPMNESININVTPILSWTGGDPNGDPVIYVVYFDTNSNPYTVEDYVNDTIFESKILNYTTQYYWKIHAYDNHGAVSTGLIWTFQTVDNVPPYIPNNPYPENGSTSVDVNTLLNWSGGDQYGDPVTYDIYFGKDPNPPKIENNYPNATYNTGRLEYNTQYYWRINASDNQSYYAISPIWTFNSVENNPPYIPNNPNPINESNDIDANTYLSWIGGDPDIGDTVEYDIYLDTNPNPQKIESNYSSIIYDPGRLEDDTQYYWSINAKDQIGFTTTGPIWTFKTTIFTNDPPNKPDKPEGTNYGRIRISYTFSSKTMDQDGDKIFYKFDWDDGTNSGWEGPYNSNETVYVSHIWNSRGSYSLKVKAKDSNGAESVWSDPLPISMPKYRQKNKYLTMQLLEKIMNIIQI